MNDWLYDKVRRVPPITDEQIMAMRRIEPVLKCPESVMYRRIHEAQSLDPRGVSFLWDAKPTGPEFTFDQLNQTEIITQHTSSVFFKPSLAEVYAWLRVFMPDTWGRVKYFCMGEPSRIGGSTDCECKCTVMGGPVLKRGEPVEFANGEIGYTLTPSK